MPFPVSERVIYRKSPLVEVISQLRFPTILKIEVEAPAEFQDEIRRDYPLYSLRLEENVLPPDLRDRLPDAVVEMFSTETRSKVYDFASDDKEWQVSLAKDFVALSTKRYARWAAFHSHIVGLVEALNDIYSPAFFVRIGLRYRNVICRSTLALERVDWSELLQPYLAGPLGAVDIDEGSVLNVATRAEIRLQDGESQARILHGLHPVGEEDCYLIDIDLFTEKRTEVSDAINRLDYFNGRAGRVFRWCISERLHLALEPREP
jgi:uncharacterized protein (TIGR04255 family)